MTPVWRKLAVLDIPANPTGLWTKALDYVGPLRRLRFQAEGKWIWLADADPQPAAPAAAPPAPVIPGGGQQQQPPPPAAALDTERECGPDGDRESPATAGHLLPDALSGALIGKIGGSTGSVKAADAFLVGAYAVIEIDDKKQGPLFLTINDTPAGMSANRNSVKVTIWESF